MATLRGKAARHVTVFLIQPCRVVYNGTLASHLRMVPMVDLMLRIALSSLSAIIQRAQQQTLRKLRIALSSLSAII